MKMLPDISILLSLSCMRWVCVGQCVSGFVYVVFFVCVFGHVRAWFPSMFPSIDPLCIPYLIPYSERWTTWVKGCSFLLGL